MKLYELLSIFPFGEKIPIVLRDNTSREITHTVNDPETSFFLDEEMQIPEELLPYADYQVISFEPIDKTIEIEIDINIRHHRDYVKSISLTI